MAACYSYAQVTYNDVAVIVNDSSSNSIEIGAYFQQQRNIPNENIIHIVAPEQEEIDTATFNAIRLQIEDYLIGNNLKDSIDYLVTTKGVPLKVRGTENDTIGSGSSSASFDSEIALILGEYSNKIGKNGYAYNTYNHYPSNFSRDSFGIYLVTRLDAYTKSQVIDLIDRSGPNLLVNKDLSKNIFNIKTNSILDDLTYDLIESFMSLGMDTLSTGQWNSEIIRDSVQLLNQENVLSYITAYFNIYEGGLNFDWVDGSLTECLVSNSAGTFTLTGNPILKVADLIADGASSGHGYVYGTYMADALRTDYVFSKYNNQSTQYNLAESYYSGIRWLSGQDVVIGDPKTSIMVDIYQSVKEAVAYSDLQIYPNPSTGIVRLSQTEGTSINQLEIRNNLGALVSRMDNLEGKSILDFSHLPNGIYFLNFQLNNDQVTKKMIIQK